VPPAAVALPLLAQCYRGLPGWSLAPHAPPQGAALQVRDGRHLPG
jgi:hypothetical protein